MIVKMLPSSLIANGSLQYLAIIRLFQSKSRFDFVKCLQKVSFLDVAQFLVTLEGFERIEERP